MPMDQIMQTIKATTTLYGAVPMEKVVEIYNQQNEDAITLNDLKGYSDRALKKEHVYAEGDYFAHQVIDDIPTLLVVQGSTPFYVPDKAELLRYVHRPPYEELQQYQALFGYVKKHFCARAADQFCDDVCGAGGSALTLDVFQAALDDADMELADREQMNELLQLVVHLANHIRL